MRTLRHALLALLLLPAAASAQNRPDPALASVPWHGEQVVAGRLLVQFRAGTTATRQAQSHAALGAIAQGVVAPRLVRVALPAGADLDALRAQYAASPDVEFAQPDLLHRPVGVPDDPQWPQQWNLAKVRADVAWDSWSGAPSGVVAIIDSGVDLTHPDLAAHYAWGLDTFAGDTDPTDMQGHGTHCAGIAAALTGNALGVAGAAPACRFAAYRCGTTSYPSSALVPAINDAVAHGALVISMSWGSSVDDPAIANALQAAANQGVLLVAAAGNDASSSPFYPAAHPFVLAVGASTSTDARATFSNFGNWVDIAAPGPSIESTWIGGQYKLLSGTSMACPLVAGAGTLLYSRLGARSPGHAAAVRAALEDTGVPIGNWVAHGRLDMAAAMNELFPPVPPHVSSVAPTQLPALHGTDLLVTGSGLSAVTGVTLGGAAAAFQATGYATLHVTAPDATALGPASLVLSGPSGTASADLAWIATSPPRLLASPLATAGAPFTWSLGGAPGETAVLIVSLHAATLAWQGQQILSAPALVLVTPLDAVGLASLSIELPGAAAGLSFHSQLVTWNGTLTGVTPVITTSVAP
jgi:thermitase